MTAASSEKPSRLLYWLASAGAALVLVILAVSADIRLSNAGLGCANWPQCYGRVGAGVDAPGPASIRATAKPVKPLATLTHRASAIATSLLVLAIAFVSMNRRPVSPTDISIAFSLLFLTAFLAVIGRWTPTSRLPAVALGNLLGGMAMLGLFWWLRLKTALQQRLAAPTPARMMRWTHLAILVLIVQIALGGLVSAKFAALSCTALPGCDSHGWTLAAFNPFRELTLGPDGAVIIGPETAAVHIAHRFGAAVTFGLLAWLAIRTFTLDAGYRPLGATMLGLLTLQLLLGISAVLNSLPLVLVLAHNSVAGLLLLTLITLSYRLARSG